MKSLFLPVAILAFTLLSCASAKNNTPQALDGNWQLAVFPAGDKTFAEIFGQRRPEINFNVSEQQVSGTTGCNRFFGPYTTADNGKLTFGANMGVTKMACPGFEEQLFLDALGRINNYKVAGKRLELRQDDVLVMTFTR